MRLPLLLFFLIQLILVETLLINLNPTELLAKGTTFKTILVILKGLIVTKQYTTLVGFLKHPAYDFSPYYHMQCETFTKEIVTDIVERVESFDDQVSLLSGTCIVRAINLWDDIPLGCINRLPVNPLAHDDFSLLYVRQEIFIRILKHALETYSDQRRPPIFFYDWLNDQRVDPFKYFPKQAHNLLFKAIVSFINPIMFSSSSPYFQKWITSIFQSQLLLPSNYAGELSNEAWILLLKAVVFMKSIGSFHDNDDINLDSKLKMRELLSQSFSFARRFGGSGLVAEKIKRLANNPPTMIEVFDFLSSLNQDLHPDWLISLLFCDFYSEQQDNLKVLKYISTKNPHNYTITTLLHMLVSDYKHFYSIFGLERMMECSDEWLEKPLIWRFKILRTSLLSFPSKQKYIVVAGLFPGGVRPTHELFIDLMTTFRENHVEYSKSFSSINILTFKEFGVIQPVEMKYFLKTSLKSFINLPELYIGNIDSGIIFSPILTKNFIQIILNFVIHYALLGETVPFKIDKFYFTSSLKANVEDLLKIYEDNSVKVQGVYLKVSLVLNSKSWFLHNRGMSNFFDSYNSIKLLRNSLFERQSVVSHMTSEAAEWLQKSFNSNSAALRSLVYSHFKLNQFNPSEIYYILFENKCTDTGY